MEKVRLGKSGMNVTRLGFGGIPIQRLPEADAIRVVRSALDLGMNWIDTANGYTVSEGFIGKAITSYDREKLYLFTKSGASDPDTLRVHIQLSLERMQVDYIDLFQFHGVSEPERLKALTEGGLLDVVREFHSQGRIRHIGASSHSLDIGLQVLDIPEIEVFQFPFNFIVEDIALQALAKTRANDIGFIAMKPFGGGMIEDIEICVRYLLQYPDLVLDPGFETVREVQEVVAVMEAKQPITTADRDKMTRISQTMGRIFCRRCQYCMPCPQGVQISNLMTMDSLLKRLPEANLVKGWARAAADSYPTCNECGLCETKCPYKLKIRERIRHGAAIYQDYLKERNLS